MLQWGNMSVSEDEMMFFLFSQTCLCDDLLCQETEEPALL